MSSQDTIACIFTLVTAGIIIGVINLVSYLLS